MTTMKVSKHVFDTSLLEIGNQHNDSYEVSSLNTLNFAFSSNDRLRGEFGPLMIAIFLFIITIIDIKYPLFFFTLNHFLDVKDPEPTDFYLGMQKVGWFIMPLIGILLMILAI